MGRQSRLRNNWAAANGCPRIGVSDRRGVTGVWVALCIVPLLGMTALAIDAGYLYVLRNRLRATADAAAVAGAIQLPNEAAADALDYAGKNMPPAEFGTVLVAADVVAAGRPVLRRGLWYAQDGCPRHPGSWRATQ